MVRHASVPLLRGAQVAAGAAIRTARDSDAMLRLRDGSLVEMRERSGFSVSEHGKDMTIGLEHGAIIVDGAGRLQAPAVVKRRDGGGGSGAREQGDEAAHQP